MGQACPAIGTAVARLHGNLIRPTGKEIVMRLLVLLTLAMFTTVLVGCRASGEVGDTQTSVSAPR